MDVKLQDITVAHEDEVIIDTMDADVALEDDMTTGGGVEHLVQEVDSADTMEVEQLAQKVCVRCGRVHDANGLEEFRRACRRPCSRCGLVHRDYMLGARIYGLDEFDCEVFLPDLNNVQMDGTVIVLPEHIIKMLDDLAKSSKQKATMVESLADVQDSDEVCFVVDSFAGETEVPDSQS